MNKMIKVNFQLVPQRSRRRSPAGKVFNDRSTTLKAYSSETLARSQTVWVPQISKFFSTSFIATDIFIVQNVLVNFHLAAAEALSE